jgi:hypothetical protein
VTERPGVQGSSRRRTLLLAVGVALAALLLWGGYAHHWSWTGINGHTATLWDWLRLILLPLAFAVLPIWLRPDARLQSQVKMAALAATGVLVLVALGGYLIPWAWTGFTGNTVWDWLHLLILPLLVPVVLIPTLKPVAEAPMTPVQDEQPAQAAEEESGEPEPAAG